MMGFAKNCLPANSSRRVAACLDNPRHGYSPLDGMYEHDKIAQRLGMLLTRLYSGEKLHLSDLATEYNVTVRTCSGISINASVIYR